MTSIWDLIRPTGNVQDRRGDNVANYYGVIPIAPPRRNQAPRQTIQRSLNPAYFQLAAVGSQYQPQVRRQAFMAPNYQGISTAQPAQYQTIQQMVQPPRFPNIRF